MRIPIDDRQSDEDVIYAPFDNAPQNEEVSPGWLDDVHVEQQAPVMSEEEAFFADADPFDAPQPAQPVQPTPAPQTAQPMQPTPDPQIAPAAQTPVFQQQPATPIEPPQPAPVLDDDEFPDIDAGESSSRPEATQPSEPMAATDEPMAAEAEPVQTEPGTAEADEQETPVMVADNEFPQADTVSKEEFDTLQQRYDRLMADWENYKRRSARELAEAKENANQNLLKAMMPAFDDFARVAFHSQTSDNPEVAEVVAGVEAIHRKLFNALAREGVNEIKPASGEPFDMNRHQAIERCPADDEHPVDSVMKVYQVGYEMNGKILRPAMVAVTV